MNITVVSDFYHPGKSRGLEEHCRLLQKHGHTVSLLVGMDDPTYFKSISQSPPFETYPFCYHRDKNTLVRLPKVRRGLLEQWQAIEEGHPTDVIIYNQPLTAALLNFSNVELPGPSLYFFHAPWAREWELNASTDRSGMLTSFWTWSQKKIRNYLEDNILHQVDTPLVLSEFMKQKLLEHHPRLTDGGIRVLPGGVNKTQFSPSDDKSLPRGRIGLPQDRTILFTLRRLVPRMGLDRLVQAYQELSDRYADDSRDLLLVIGGEGPQREKLEQMANRHGSSDIKFVGYIDEENVADYYRSADLFVLPTRKLEGFGYVTLEALASGVPVVATRVGGSREILGQLDEGLFLPDYNVQAWADHLEQILESDKLSPEFAQKCREFAVENYSWDIIGETLNRFVQETVAHCESD
ncbi:MAG: glycosyltransferase family 4 protein [bacterium]